MPVQPILDPAHSIVPPEGRTPHRKGQQGNQARWLGGTSDVVDRRKCPVAPAVVQAASVDETLIPFNYAELAAALYAADLPVKGWQQLPIEQIKLLVRSGIARLGIERVEYVAQQTRRLNLLLMEKLSTKPAGRHRDRGRGASCAVAVTATR